MRLGPARLAEVPASCAGSPKHIASVAAIVAPHSCTLVRDAASVSALARPALGFVFPAGLFPVMLGFVLPSLLDKFLCPEPNLHSAKRLNWRGLNATFTNPSMQSVGGYVEKFRNSDRW